MAGTNCCIAYAGLCIIWKPKHYQQRRPEENIFNRPRKCYSFALSNNLAILLSQVIFSENSTSCYQIVYSLYHINNNETVVGYTYCFADSCILSLPYTPLPRSQQRKRLT